VVVVNQLIGLARVVDDPVLERDAASLSRSVNRKS